jgi:hypothetical protein
MRMSWCTTKAVNPFRLVASPFRRAYAAAIATWVTANGFDWTASRAKSIAQYLIELRAGGKPQRPSWVAPRWLTYPERICVSGSDAKFIELIQVLRVFTRLGYAKSGVTREDEDKFTNAVMALPTSSHVIVGKSTSNMSIPHQSISLYKLFTDVHRKAKSVMSLGVHPSEGLYRAHAHQLLKGRGVVSFPNMMSLAGRHFEEMVGNMFIVTMTSNGWKFSGDKSTAPYTSLPWVLKSVGLPQIEVPFEFKTFAGSVHHRIQTDGKVRYFYSPPVWVQYLLRPWARKLYSSLKKIDQDCTFDQVKGVHRCSRWLKDGRKLWSYDLSSATDRFPLAFTEEFLRKAHNTRNWQAWVLIFLITSRLPARFADRDGRVSVMRWRCGQPLGTISSFAAFALSHHYIMRCLGSILQVPKPLDYVILGDDIVIANERLAIGYRLIMDLLGVEISLSKSLSSPLLGEFAGRLVGPQAFGFKLKYPVPTLRSLPALIDLIGPKALRWLPKSHLRDAIALLPLGASPGYNPGGFPQSSVDRFLKAYYASEPRDDDHYPTPVVGTPLQTIVKSEILTRFQVVPQDPNVEPRGSLSVDKWGAPVPSGISSKGTWRQTPFLSRRWLSRVRKAMRDSQLMH